MAVTPVAHPITQCLHCKKPVFDNKIIVTKCCHIFDKACLEEWLQRKNTCPLDQAIISLPECQPLTTYLHPFSEYYAENEAFVISTLPKSLEDQVEKVCSICTGEEFAAVYFIPDNKCFMHSACWIELHPTKTSSPPIWYPQQIATLERKWVESKRPSKLPSPATLPALPSSAMAPAESPRKPLKPITPTALVLIAVAPVISLWAYMMNTRIYKNSNPFLFVLSIPVLITLKILFFASFLFKRIFTERKA